MHQRFSMGISLGFLLVLTAPANSQNLLTNSAFDNGPQLAGWTSFGSAAPADGTRTWSTNDAAGLATSGSALMTITATAPAGTVVGLSQCIDISGQAALSTYKFFTSADAPAAQNQESRAVVEIAFFSNVGCTTFQNLGEGQGGNVNIIVPQAPPWSTFPGNATAGGVEGTGTAPSGANGLQVRIYLERIGGSSQQQVQFDSVVTHLQGTTPVQLITFVAE
ncbi:MAG: hypothetical protein ABIT01_10665 [Thermoanaerobaculia bacterium]